MAIIFQYLDIVTPSGEVCKFARNASSSSEFAGSTFSPDGTTLFVNIQKPGLSLAITGPWQNTTGVSGRHITSRRHPKAILGNIFPNPFREQLTIPIELLESAGGKSPDFQPEWGTGQGRSTSDTSPPGGHDIQWQVENRVCNCFCHPVIISSECRLERLWQFAKLSGPSNSPDDIQRALLIPWIRHNEFGRID